MKIWSGVVTENVQESRDFYMGVLGCELVFESDWFVLLGLGPVNTYLTGPVAPEKAPIKARGERFGYSK